MSQRRVVAGLRAAALIWAWFCGHPASALSGPEKTPASPTLTRGHGVVVETVEPESALEKAGIEAGDLLLRWRRLAHPPANPTEESGNLASIFDWYRVTLDQAPRGPVILSGARGGMPKSFQVDPGSWKAELRPAMEDSQAVVWARVQQHLRAGEVESALRLGEDLIARATQEKDAELECFLALRIANVLVQDGKGEKASTRLESELAGAQDPACRFELLNVLGDAYLARGKPDAAATAYDSAAGLAASPWGSGLILAEGHNNQGYGAFMRKDFAAARQHHQAALVLREKMAPGSPQVATSLFKLALVSVETGDDLPLQHRLFTESLELAERLHMEKAWIGQILMCLGNIADTQGNLEEAEGYLMRALDKTSQATESLELAKILGNLGLVTFSRGDLEQAERYTTRSSQIFSHLAPGSVEFAVSLQHLAGIARKRGELDQAEERYLQAHAILQKFGESLDLAISFANLATLAQHRRDHDLAEQRFEEALRIYEKQASGSWLKANTLSGLGEIHLARGRLDLAEKFLRQALAIDESLAPDSVETALTLVALGRLKTKIRDFDAARELLQRALAIYERKAPGNVGVRLVLSGLGEHAEARGALAQAESYYRRSIDVLPAELRAGGLDFQGLCSLGRVLVKSGRLKEARETYWGALRSFEARLGRLGGAESVGRYQASETAYFVEPLLSLLFRQKKYEEAFNVLERVHGRGLLASLAERDLGTGRDLPVDLRTARARIASDYDRLQGKLLASNAGSDREALSSLQEKMRELRARDEELTAEIRRISPRYAALRHPLPLSFGETQKALDPGTVLLSYSLGKKQSFLLAVMPDHPLVALRLKVTESALRKDVDRFRTLLFAGPPGMPQTALRRASAEKLGRQLFARLIAPVAPWIEGRQRILIIPEGPLHSLPWGALVRPGVDRRSRLYLAQWKPLHFALSATVYSELRTRRPATSPGEGAGKGLIAFGDPLLPNFSQPETLTDLSMRSLATRGFRFEPLPASRAEVSRIAALDPAHSEVFLAAEATEERARARAADARYLHFATHGLLDERMPLNSAVVLSIPEELTEGRHNGLLQAWEIIDDVRLDCDLVVLSSCDSGLGQELGGEGLIGLTRAFQYAGAHSVLASLWKISDDATAELMVRFYRHLHQGQAKAEALQDAQRELIEGPITVSVPGGGVRRRDVSAPFYWAGFQIYGDWR